jgi:hypothetical protein
MLLVSGEFGSAGRTNVARMGVLLARRSMPSDPSCPTVVKKESADKILTVGGPGVALGGAGRGPERCGVGVVGDLGFGRVACGGAAYGSERPDGAVGGGVWEGGRWVVMRRGVSGEMGGEVGRVADGSLVGGD